MCWSSVGCGKAHETSYARKCAAEWGHQFATPDTKDMLLNYVHWTLRRVAEHAAQRPDDYQSYVKMLADSLSGAAPGDVLAAIEQEPGLVESAWMNAHLAGLAECLAQRTGLEAPAWTLQESRFLPEPKFFGGEAMHAMLLAQTPSCMRRRNVFCGPVAMQSIRGAK